jgi:hypothetical protein
MIIQFSDLCQFSSMFWVFPVFYKVLLLQSQLDFCGNISLLEQEKRIMGEKYVLPPGTRLYVQKLIPKGVCHWYLQVVPLG